MQMYDNNYLGTAEQGQDSKMSKHAKRRANKRARQAEAEVSGPNDQNQQQQQWEGKADSQD